MRSLVEGLGWLNFLLLRILFVPLGTKRGLFYIRVYLDGWTLRGYVSCVCFTWKGVLGDESMDGERGICMGKGQLVDLKFHCKVLIGILDSAGISRWSRPIYLP